MLISQEVSNISSFLKNIDQTLSDFRSDFNTWMNVFNYQLAYWQKALSLYFGFDFDFDFSKDLEDAENMFSYNIKQTLKDVLLDVYKTIDNYTNPRSEDNVEAFNAALTNVKDNTFIGSAYEVVDTVPNDIKNALTTDSSPVLTFKTSGVSNSYFSIPAKSYSINFSWYAPYKGVGDTVISCFMYLGFLVAFWKRLPEIIHGAGVTFVGGADFYENQMNDKINDTMANDYYEHLKSNGGIDDF